MNKGKQTLYNNLIPNSIAERKGGGRKAYLEARNNAMAARFYYHSYIIRRRYDDTMCHLSEEFFLSPEQIADQLKDHFGYINTMVENDVSPTTLRKQIPFFDWSVRGL